ncbi:MAG: hypothetical protein J6P83_01470 [Bacteroidales bacterium]|nr:hypothetical protein [Bacteroidales bacterium]
MKRVLPLLLLAFVMCQCNFGSSDQPAKKSLRDKFPEKFTEEYIGDRALTLGDKLCNCDPYNVYAFNNVFTPKYGDLLKEALALPGDRNEDYNLVWTSFSEEMCRLVAVTDIKVNDNKAKITMDSEYSGEDELSMVFVDDEWLIDDLGNCSKEFMKEVIQNQRKFYKTIDWLEYIEDLEHTGHSKEEAVELSNQFKEDIETYFENYPK